MTDFNYHFRDGVDAINIGMGATTALGKRLGWYDNTLKALDDGSRFHMYAGLHYYLITEGNNRRFLNAVVPEDLKGSKSYAWQNVPGLETHLESALLFNLRSSPLIIELITQYDLPIIWEEPLRDLRNNELRWLRVVRRAVTRIRYEHK